MKLTVVIAMFALLFHNAHAVNCDQPVPECASGDQKCQNERMMIISGNQGCQKDKFKPCKDTFEAISKAKRDLSNLVGQDSGVCKSPGIDSLLKQAFKKVKNRCPQTGVFERDAPSELLQTLRTSMLSSDESNFSGEFYDGTPEKAANDTAKRVQSMFRAKCNTILGRSSKDPSVSPNIENTVVPIDSTTLSKPKGQNATTGALRRGN